MSLLFSSTSSPLENVVNTSTVLMPTAHLWLQDFVDLSAGRGKQGASRKCGSSNGYAMAPQQVLFSVFTAGRWTGII